MPISILPESLINKIAAGEVIVRPASVVKELVENAIDAGATRIVIETANGCRDLKVRDDGCGIDRHDAALALVRHATSKISDFEDLWSLDTRGFRGEALASIAAVSRVQILTRKREHLAGTRVLAEGAGEPRIEPAGAPEGTEVRVRDLFFNTPARLKFMKSAASELQQVLLTVTRQALILPQIGFTVQNEKSALLDVPPDQPWNERVGMLLGSQIPQNLLEVDAERHGLRVRGFIVNPAVSRKDRRHQFFFVNGRPVSSRSLSYVLQQAYHGVIMTQRFPIAVLDIVLPPGEVDVNVHPTKDEVRFRAESAVNGAVFRTVQERLGAANLLRTMNLPGSEQSAPAAGASSFSVAASPAPQHRQDEMPVDFGAFTSGIPTSRPLHDSFAALQRSAGEVLNATHEFENVEQVESRPSPAAQFPTSDDGSCSVRPLAHSMRQMPDSSVSPGEALFQNGHTPEPLGQVALCYIIARAGEDLLLIDQHAAHERLLYIQLADARRPVSTQPLLLPVSVDVPAAAIPYMQRLVPILQRVGLQAEYFGGQTFLVQAVPADLRNFDAAAVLADLIDDFDSLGKIEQIEVLHDRVVTRMACRAAIKAGQNLHLEEMRALIRDIAAARLGFTCPHGRPTMILLTRDQLDRQFKRKL